MYVKYCPNCEKSSYSATKKGNWICPNCKKDITKIKAEKPKVDN